MVAQAVYVHPDSSLVNSHVMYVVDQQDVGLPLQARQQWHYDLVESLLCDRLRPENVRGPRQNLTPNGFHQIEGHPIVRRYCVVCNRRIHKFCGGYVGAFMCDGPFYIIVHTQPGMLLCLRCLF